MTSDPDRVYVWVFPPGQTDPVVCGVIDTGDQSFRYGHYYLREHAVPLYGLPPHDESVPVPEGLLMHGVVRDALPDGWGQRVIAWQFPTSTSRYGLDVSVCDAGVYMLKSGSDRFGALDFQAAPDVYVPRMEEATVTLGDLMEAADAIQQGDRLESDAGAALVRATSVGGAMPKVTVRDGDGSFIVKLSAVESILPRLRYEALATDLAGRFGVQTCDCELIRVGGRDALKVRRFDRAGDGARLHAVSMLTVLGLDAVASRRASYPAFLDRLDGDRKVTGEQLFRRVAANIALGNVDDHARNHAALWDGESLTLAPAFDLEPCRGANRDEVQAISYGREYRHRVSSLTGLCRQAAAYGLRQAQARSLVNDVVGIIRDNWPDAVARAGLTVEQAGRLVGRVVLNEGVLDGLPPRPVASRGTP